MLERLDGTIKHGMEEIANKDDGTEMSITEARTKAAAYTLLEDDFKYSLLQVPLSGVRVNSVPETYYFFPVQVSVIDRNPSIEQNSNWGGPFDPTLEQDLRPPLLGIFNGLGFLVLLGFFGAAVFKPEDDNAIGTYLTAFGNNPLLCTFLTF